MAKNKTYKDYKEIWFGLEQKKERLEKEIRERLLVLASNNPDAIIVSMNGTDIKAKSVANTLAINNISVGECLLIIQRIEEWLNAQHPHQQLVITEFTKDE